MKRQEGKPSPWTDDSILHTYYFTNPYRENDKVTKWFRENIRDPLSDRPEVLFATICFRWFNYIPTGQQLILPRSGKPVKADASAKLNKLMTSLVVHWDLDHAKGHLHNLKEDGQQIFTGAFNISNSGSTKPKIDRVCDDYIQPAWEQREVLHDLITREPTLATAFRVLSKLPGLGGSGFMAAQVVCDLKYTHLLKEVDDWWTWCSPGPGSKRGMNRLLGYNMDARITPSQWNTEMGVLIQTVGKELPNLMGLHAQDIQNCLCEYDKYCRALSGEGHMKRKYQGTKP